MQKVRFYKMNNNKRYNQNMYNNNLNNLNNMNNMNFNGVSPESDTEDFMYPEVYHHFAPVADQIIKEMERQYGDIYLTEDLLNKMTDEAIRRSGFDPASPVSSSSGVKNGEAIPVMSNFGYGRHGGGNWRGYDRGAVSDIFRILLLQQIFGGRRPRWRRR